MVNENNNHDFERERQKTDKSLGAERFKATESMKLASEKSQSQTDRRLNQERAKADRKMANSRVASDIVGNGQTQHQLDDERRITDEATKAERTSADMAIDKERLLVDKLVVHVLDQEREITDKNLSAERASTDTYFEGATASLKSEINEHVKTKMALTSREELLAIVSHDLRNPVGTASSYATLILEMDNVSDVVKSHVSTIKRNAETALRLIADLMEMERFAQNKWHFHFVQCSPADLIQQTLEDFSFDAKQKNIKLSTRAPDSATVFSCDNDRLMQVLSNLVSNALKFTPSHGAVTIGAKVVDDDVCFTVSDNGLGIPRAQHKQIFGRFAQLQSKNRTGLGLGLYISKMLIEAHGGNMWVESSEGQGSTFFFTVPLTRSPHADLKD